jgi:SAM-dependent methyltransferase
MLRNATTHAVLLRELLQFDRILEVGIGTGTLSALLSCVGKQVVSIDNNAEVLRTAQAFQRRLGSVKLVLADAFHLPFGDSTFDAAFSQGLLEHFRDREIRALVEEQVRVAGRAYISVPSVFFPHVRRFGFGLVGDERLLSLASWRRILADFDVVGRYYADFKLLTVARWTFPWPTHILMRATRRPR